MVESLGDMTITGVETKAQPTTSAGASFLSFPLDSLRRRLG
jgi:hypothetical protein